ncbi:MAG: UbiA family prenyltransferase [Candidatus Krumholzibacteriota bacterium]|nr:UbiA family prenyltransferase [Candidatus Krumholzibacteriota bacterium]
MIQFPHTLFALPFALLAAMIAAREAPTPGFPGWRILLLILACMVTARSAAMAYNRLMDRRDDAANPRTAGRALPAGRLTPRWVALFTAANGLLFLLFAALLNPLASRLAPLALAWILAYSHAKRLCAGSHFILGASLAIAPVGAWVAVRGTLAGAPWLLALAVVLWVAGFDTVYALQDLDFDRRRGLRSLAVALGPAAALRAAALCHLLMVLALVAFAWRRSLGVPFGAGLVLASLLLIWEHRVLRGGDLRRIDLAFFRLNSAAGVVIFLAGGLDIVLSA